MSYNVIVADDHPIYRKSLVDLVKMFIPTEHVDQAKDGFEVLELFSNGHYDLILMDISMPGMGGLECLEKLQKISNGPPVIAITSHSHLTRELLELGAKGYMDKNCDPPELERIIKNVLSGGTHFPKLHLPGIRPFKLTPQEIRVLELICQEKNTKQIADLLYVSQNTIESHRKSLMEKTGSTNLAGLVKFALNNGYDSV